MSGQVGLQASPQVSLQVSLGVTPFDRFYYKSCLHMPLMAAVQHFGGDLSRFWTNDVFVYGQDEGASALALTAFHFENRPEAEILKQMGIDTDPISPEDDLIGALQAAIGQGALVLVPVDRFSYHSRYNTLYRREHYPHHVLVCGFNVLAGTFEVIDAPETPIEGKNAFLAEVGFESVWHAHRDYLEFCDRSGRAVRLSRRTETAHVDFGSAAASLRETLLANREQILSGLSCLNVQAAALRSMDFALLKAEPLEIVLRRLFPIDRAKEAEYFRIAVAFPGCMDPLGELMRKIQMSLKEYKLSLGSFLLRGSLSASNRETLAIALERIYGLERGFNHGLFEALEQKTG
ncbi:hypothetical protein [Bradyrhizobium sp.]|uniref:hypothetical protein n=1 Tax=Bradyrhizobium sp. TaxID=376 RepID=UPI003C18E25E